MLEHFSCRRNHFKGVLYASPVSSLIPDIVIVEPSPLLPIFAGTLLVPLHVPALRENWNSTQAYNQLCIICVCGRLFNNLQQQGRLILHVLSHPCPGTLCGNPQHLEEAQGTKEKGTPEGRPEDDTNDTANVVIENQPRKISLSPFSNIHEPRN